MIVGVVKDGVVEELVVNDKYIVSMRIIEKYDLSYTISRLVDSKYVMCRKKKELYRLYGCRSAKKEYNQLQLLCSNGFTLKGLYILGESKELAEQIRNKYRLSFYWTRGKNQKHLVLGGTAVPVGLICCTVYDTFIDILMIETINKNMGYGRKIVNHLLTIRDELSGMSLTPARGFWLKLGANFEPNSDSFVLRKDGIYNGRR